MVLGNGVSRSPEPGKRWDDSVIPKKAKKSKPEPVKKSTTLDKIIFSGSQEENSPARSKRVTKKKARLEKIDHSGQHGKPFRKK